jgi:hypothetical protein
MSAKLRASSTVMLSEAKDLSLFLLSLVCESSEILRFVQNDTEY